MTIYGKLGGASAAGNETAAQQPATVTGATVPLQKGSGQCEGAAIAATSETPETDAAYFLCYGDAPDYPIVVAEFARDLERRLRAAVTDCQQWRTWPITEIAIRNESVMEHLNDLEKRAEAAEADAKSWAAQCADRVKDWDEMRARAEAAERERDELRELLQQSARHVFIHAAASHLTEGFHPKRNEWDELADKLRAKGFK